MTLNYLTWYLVQLHSQRSEGAKGYEDYTIDDWGDLVERCLVSSQLRQTCDKFAETTIEEARRRRLFRFTREMGPILKDLAYSLE